MTSISRFLPVLLAGAAVLTTACHDRAEVRHERVQVDAGNATFAKRDSARSLSPGDVRIATVDSAVEVALIGDSLVAGLGPMTLRKIKNATDTANVKSSGLGASIEKFVKGTVADALDHELHYPLSEISDVRYEDGALVF